MNPKTIPLFDRNRDHPPVPTWRPPERCAQTPSRMPLAAPAVMSASPKSTRAMGADGAIEMLSASSEPSRSPDRRDPAFRRARREQRAPRRAAADTRIISRASAGWARAIDAPGCRASAHFHGLKPRSGPLRVSKLLVLSTWTPAL